MAASGLALWHPWRKREPSSKCLLDALGISCDQFVFLSQAAVPARRGVVASAKLAEFGKKSITQLC